MFRISHPTHHTVVEVASVAEIEDVVRTLPTGQYVINKTSDEFDPLARAAERQGTVTKLPNGSVKMNFSARRIEPVTA
jgi:hypothetical protein